MCSTIINKPSDLKIEKVFEQLCLVQPPKFTDDLTSSVNEDRIRMNSIYGSIGVELFRICNKYYSLKRNFELRIMFNNFKKESVRDIAHIHLMNKEDK